MRRREVLSENSIQYLVGVGRFERAGVSWKSVAREVVLGERSFIVEEQHVTFMKTFDSCWRFLNVSDLWRPRDKFTAIVWIVAA